MFPKEKLVEILLFPLMFGLLGIFFFSAGLTLHVYINQVLALVFKIYGAAKSLWR